jgi:hypothetical protein
MSYILQALKKAEEARGATPGAVAMPGAPPPMSRPRWQWIAGGAAGLACIGVAAALWTLGPGAGDAPAVRSQDPPARAAVDSATPGAIDSRATATAVGRAAPAAVTAPTMSSAPPVEPRTVAAPEPRAVAPASDVGPRPPAQTGGVDRPPARAERASSRAPAAPPPATPPAERAVAAAAPRPSVPPVVAPQAASAPAASPPAAPAPTVIPEAAVPPRPAPSPSASHTPPVSEFRALMAKLSLQVLSFSTEPRDRFVFVNGRKYVEGQAIDDKLLIERITDGGVVLSYRGERATLTSP